MYCFSLQFHRIDDLRSCCFYYSASHTHLLLLILIIFLLYIFKWNVFVIWTLRDQVLRSGLRQRSIHSFIVIFKCYKCTKHDNLVLHTLELIFDLEVNYESRKGVFSAGVYNSHN